MIELVSLAFSTVVYGLLATAAIMAMLYFILHEISRKAVRNIPFFITGIVLFPLLLTQFTLFFGAIEAKSLVDAIEIFVSQSLESMHVTPTDMINGEDSQEMLHLIIQQYPILGVFVDTCTFSGTQYSDLAQTIGETLRDYLNSYMWRRIFWIIGFVVVATAIAILVPSAGYKDAVSRTSSRRERYSPRRSERHHMRRR